MSNDVLRIADVRVAIGLALDAFEAERGGEIPIEHDYYWHLPVKASFDLSHEPSDLTVGQISDDLAEVLGFNTQGDAEPAWHALAHVIGLLRLLENAAQPVSRRDPWDGGSRRSA